jgi:hypothetical protein
VEGASLVGELRALVSADPLAEPPRALLIRCWSWVSGTRNDEGSLDAPGARDAARAELGEAGFAAAYARGRALGRDEAIAVAEGAVEG